MHGAFLKKTLEKEKIGVLNLIEDEHYFTTLAFVAIDENGEREFSFSRKPGADTKLQADELNLELLQNCKIFHFGSLSLTAQPAHEATVTAVSHFHFCLCITSFQQCSLRSVNPRFHWDF